MSAQQPLPFSQLREQPKIWGRFVESAVGAHLLNSIRGTGIELFYWRDDRYEVDFVLSDRRNILGLEMKSGMAKERRPGVERFKRSYPGARFLLVGQGGMPLEEFFREDVRGLLQKA